MEIPKSVSTSRLYRVLSADAELLTALNALREMAGKLADTTARTVPEFTDHTLRHMDALWTVADHILTESEATRCTAAEAFLIGTGFYLHDIGMAAAATKVGRERIEASISFASATSPTPGLEADDVQEKKSAALSYVVRTEHARVAVAMATEPLPGTNIYLFADATIRAAWALTCGEVAASHHWSMTQVESKFGIQGSVPLPGGRSGDLGFAASILRLVDYAHINRERANPVDRMLRPNLPAESVVHWDAQENVDGPERQGGDLVYRAAQPIKSVDAWWLYYEMLRGLDNEIGLVRRYLERRSASVGRLTLQGVRGAASPAEAALMIPTGGFLPLEISLRAASMERLVAILAGEALYGPDPYVALRELIQNARDAIHLKAITATTDFERAALSIPIRVSTTTGNSITTLSVTDAGIGMSQRIITDYLLSIASSYWTSQVAFDFPNAKNVKPAGKFGIGFLSIFMLGEHVEVETNRSGGERSSLTLRGVGRRGELRSRGPGEGSGTTIKVQLKKELIPPAGLASKVRQLAPMIDHSIEINDNGKPESLPKGWLLSLPQTDFLELARDTTLRQPLGRVYFRRHNETLATEEEAQGVWGQPRPEFTTDTSRLVVSSLGTSLLCVRGIAVQSVRTPGFAGAINLDDASTNVSRDAVLRSQSEAFVENARKGARAGIIERLDLLNNTLVTNRMSFFEDCATLYGVEVLLNSSLRWITVLTLPGEARLVSCADLLALLGTANSLFLAYGTGPWTSMSHWADATAKAPENASREIAIAIGETSAQKITYLRSDDALKGNLRDVWPAFAEAPLLTVIISILSGAWQASAESLASNTQDWTHTESKVWGHFRRSS